MDHTRYTTNKAERKPGKHLTREDGGAIEAMKKLGQSNRAIARYLNCSPTTVSNELKRGTRPRIGRRGRTSGCSAKRGMLVYQTHRANSHKPHRICKCSAFVQWVVNKVHQEKWSLDACAGYARKHKLFLPTEMVSTKTLYNEIWAGNFALGPLELPEALKWKKCCKSTAKRKKAYGTTIDERPEIASSRLEVGHWEGDTLVGKRNGKEAVILTLPEKKTQHYLAIRIPGKTGEEVCREWLYHIGVPTDRIETLAHDKCNTTTCFMPYINAFFQPRKESDRPKVVPEGAVNFAFIGQFAETPRDTIFTTEYSMRTGMESVYTLLDIDRGVPEVWGSKYDVREILRACYYAIDKKPISQAKLSFAEKEMLKFVIKKVKGTDIELLLKESGLIE